MLKNDYNTGIQLNLSNCNCWYPLINFGLPFQEEKVTGSPNS